MGRSGLGALSLALAFGCGGLLDEPAPDLVHPHSEAIGNVLFKVPGNWATATEYQDGVRTTTVESSGNARLVLYDADAPLGIDAAGYAARICDQMEGEIAGTQGAGVMHTNRGDIVPVTRTWFGQPHVGAAVPMSVKAEGVEVPFQLEVYVREGGGRSLVVYTQVPVEDAVLVQPGFDLIVGSMAVTR